LSDLRALPAAYRGYEDQLAASAVLRARAWQQPLDLATGRDRALHLPPMPPDRRHVDSDAELRRLAEAGIPERYGMAPPAAMRVRLEHELEVIAGKRFASYILTVHAIVRGRRTCGRGSGASSLVVYLLGITNVDPLRWNLLFDRFLSPERFDPPDLDVDFAWDERDDVLSSILATFGDAHVAMVATHQHLSRHGALREAARAFGLPDAAITAMAARLEERRDFGIDRDGDAATSALPAPWPAALAAAARLTGLPRHCGVHCGGVVITVPPLASLVPVHPAAKQVADAAVPGTLRAMPTIAWEKDGAEQFGLVKIDILGNRSLAVVRDCLADLAAVGRAPGPEWDPLTDDATRTLLARGDTMGCFYVESPAMRQLQAKVGDGSFDRLVVHSSIIRPAGMAFIRTYIARHHHLRRYGTLTPDEEREWYPHPVLQELLSESYGVLSYQEDVMLVAQRMAGFSIAEANRLRKALGRSDTAERLAELVGRFHAGCSAAGVAPATSELIWRMISSFAGYSFAKAHSASYAVVSMQCAWLKAHHPAVFLARVIANEGGFYRRSAYVEEARRLGIAILAPCVVSGVWATVGGDAGAGSEPASRGWLRLGLHCVSGLSRATADAIVAARRSQPFAGITDLLRRSGCAADEAQALLDAGALEALAPASTPAQRAWTVALATTSKPPARTTRGQQLIAWGVEAAGDPVPPPLPVSAHGDLARRRYARLGALSAAHPLSLWRLSQRPALRLRELTQEWHGRRIAVVGLIITRKDVNAVYEEDDGQRTADMAFATLEDETGLLETTWFPETWLRHGLLLGRDEPLLLSGRIEVDVGVCSLVVDSARSAVG
jgi:DNA polymerase-3 subunit alpha/error-prone DNA polymerase